MTLAEPPRGDRLMLSGYPGFWINLLTLGIARGRWIANANKMLGRGGAGFWFAWLLMPFAHYGVARRLNEALTDRGSSHQESPILCFLFTGFPFFGSTRRLRRAANRYNDTLQVANSASRALSV